MARELIPVLGNPVISLIQIAFKLLGVVFSPSSNNPQRANSRLPPTDHFTVLDPPDPPVDKSYGLQKRLQRIFRLKDCKMFGRGILAGRNRRKLQASFSGLNIGQRFPKKQSSCLKRVKPNNILGFVRSHPDSIHSPRFPL